MSTNLSLSLAPAAGTTIAIVGGCGGIGSAVTSACVSLSLQVSVLDLAASIARADLPPTVHRVALDATHEKSVEAAFAQVARRWGGLDLLVNLCGFSNPSSTTAEMSLTAWDETIQGNVNSTFLCCRAALPLLKASPVGAMVNIASGQAVRPLAGFGPYSASKAAVIALTKTIALECAPVRANVVAPGAVNTAFFTGGTGRQSRDSTFDMQAYARSVPLARAAEAEDIVGPILFLLGTAARFVNGQVLHVNGGGLMP